MECRIRIPVCASQATCIPSLGSRVFPVGRLAPSNSRNGAMPLLERYFTSLETLVSMTFYHLQEFAMAANLDPLFWAARHQT